MHQFKTRLHQNVTKIHGKGKNILDFIFHFSNCTAEIWFAYAVLVLIASQNVVCLQFAFFFILQFFSNHKICFLCKNTKIIDQRELAKVVRRISCEEKRTKKSDKNLGQLAATKQI